MESLIKLRTVEKQIVDIHKTAFLDIDKNIR